MALSFNDTKTAFAYKDDKGLRNARFLFASMAKKWLVQAGLWATPRVLKWGLPVKGIIRDTLFRQFVGGETLGETQAVASVLGDYHVGVILDYGVEGKEGEQNYDQARDEFIRVINFASERRNVPFMSIKLTGMSRFSLLEKLHSEASYQDVVKGRLNLEALTRDEMAEWERVCDRMLQICTVAAEKRVGVMLDAEDSWIQHPADALATQMMMKFNQEHPVFYNTAQLYRHDRLQYLRDVNHFARSAGFKAAFKLVRGAYMEKERARAQELGYPSPINPDKASTDQMFDDALRYCLHPEQDMYTLVGSHNEASNMLAANLISQYGLPNNTPRVYFSQLYGMSDNITFNLAQSGYNATKYLPFGPIHDVIPYLMRRAEENSAMGGQTGRELNLINAEIKRRRSG